MSSDVKLNDARRKVQSVLKDKMKVYLGLMGSWFRGKLTKEEFDSQARDLFTDNTVRVHNEFLLAMLNRCQSAAGGLATRDVNKPSATVQAPPHSVQRQKSVKKKPFVKTNFTQRFQPGNQLRQVRAMVSPPPATAKPMFASSSYGLLPDPAMIEGRLFVTAWEVELENIHSQIYALISYAAESLLKDIISHVLCCRRGYRVSSTAKVKQYIGIDVPMIYLSSVDREEPGMNPILKAQQKEADAVQSLARAGHVTPTNEPITPHDMFTALQSKREVIGSFAAYTLALERLSSRLYHQESAVQPQQQLTSSKKRRLLSLAPSPTT